MRIRLSIYRMLIATPYRNFDVRDKSPPRVISEIRKTYASCSPTGFRPRLTGDLLLKYPEGVSWLPGRVSVRCGQLVVWSPKEMGGGGRGVGVVTVRLPLRHLSLRAGPLPNSLTLCRGNNVVLTMQASNQRAFDDWVKTIAIELIRQTPLDAIKYLDILTIAECWKRRDDKHQDWNHNCIDRCQNCENVDHTNKSSEMRVEKGSTSPSVNEDVEEKKVEDLMRKCQNVETYVPVKDKLFLFESLCKLGRKVRSTEDVSLKIETSSKRARSLHDLSNIHSHIAVREICKYFEDKNDSTLANNRTVSKFKLKLNS